jgi:ferredoxin-NADP reductase
MLQTCHIIRITSLNHHVREFAIQPVFAFTPGQFLSVHIKHQDKMIRRSYSIANVPELSYLSFSASYVPGGKASEYLFNLKEGDAIQCTGPYGKLTLSNVQDVKRVYLVGTGTGITPYRAMLNQLASFSGCVHILQGVRLRSELLYKEDWLLLKQKNPLINITFHYSRETHVSEAYEHIGRITHYLFKHYQPQAHDRFYLCGNPGMIDDCYAWLMALKVPFLTVFREKYIS